MSLNKNNLRKEESFVSNEDREKLFAQTSAVLWFTGLSGSGKSSIAKNLEKALFDMGKISYVLDGDNLRHGLNEDLGFSLNDREENIRRVGEVSKLFCESGFFTLSAFISPYRKNRDLVRKILPKNKFIEVYVKCSLEVCESRDVKGLYKKAREGLIKGFTGIDDPYEEPLYPELVIKSDKLNLDESVNLILNYLKKNNYF